VTGEIEEFALLATLPALTCFTLAERWLVGARQGAVKG
jgi:hypothetical protein